ncbi:MAG: hydrogenase expression/formation protein HypE [Nanoarchaeota archaeon]
MNNKKECPTGECPPMNEKVNPDVVKLSEGSGGKEMHRLISEIAGYLNQGKWKHTDEDSASLTINDKNLLFTTDSYVVTPLFFPGGNIGKIAFCGTVNDLSVMGAKPLGISLGLIIEEGFSKDDLLTIIKTIGELSKVTGIPVVTGDTKVMEKGSVDKIIINTSGVGMADFILDKPLRAGDKIIVSGGVGEHGTALLAKRFELETSIETDSRPLWEEINTIKNLIKQAKDITRGGLAAVLNEIAEKEKMQFIIYEEQVPLMNEVRALTEILGIEVYSLACEGRFLCICSPEHEKKVLEELKKFNPMATTIGEVKEGKDVVVQTKFGKKILSMPSGNIVPRIC